MWYDAFMQSTTNRPITNRPTGEIRRRLARWEARADAILAQHDAARLPLARAATGHGRQCACPVCWGEAPFTLADIG